MVEYHKNLPHYNYSCAVNAIFVALSYLDVNSNDLVIKYMLEYCRDIKGEFTVELGKKLIKTFYEIFDISSEYKNADDHVLKKIYYLLEFGDSQIVYGDYTEIELTKKTLLLRYGQISNVLNDNIKNKIYNNAILPYYLNGTDVKTIKNYEFKNMDLIRYNNNIYMPFIYVVCIGKHYYTYVNFGHCLVRFDDLNGVTTFDEKYSMKIINGLQNLDFIGYIKYRS